MDGLSGLTTTLQISEGKPVALMSGIAKRATAEETLEAGAIGFLPKTMGAGSLVNAIRFMAMGERYACGIYAGKEDEVVNPLADKFDRELEVLDGLCRGLGTRKCPRVGFGRSRSSCMSKICVGNWTRVTALTRR